MHDTLSAVTALPLPSRQWLRDHAPSLDRTTRHATALLLLLAKAGLLRETTDLDDAVDALADVSSESLAAGFVLYSQRGFIEVLRLSHNVALREHLLPAVEEGRLAGALGLSGAMGHLAHGTPLPVQAVETPRGWKLSGRLSWVPNLQHDGYAVAVPVAFEGLKDFAIVMLGSEENGLTRTPDYGTGNLRSIRAAALQLDRVHFREDELLHVNGARHIRDVVPSLLALQCGLAMGVARGASSAAALHGGSGTALRRIELERLDAVLQENRAALCEGLREGRFLHDAVALLKLRSRFVELAQAAVQAEQQAIGTDAVLAGEDGGCARRTAEVQFLSLLRPNAGDLPFQPSPARRAA
jgi:alkylation response protein AidB-like acyl-CoA dehydrogenase